MSGKSGKVLLLVLIAAMLSTMAAYAEEEPPRAPHSRGRIRGVVMAVDLSASTFSLQAGKGSEGGGHDQVGQHGQGGGDGEGERGGRRAKPLLILRVNEATVFESANGSVKGLADLKAGMKALVTAERLEGGQLLAKQVVVGKADRSGKKVRAVGQVASLGQGTFSITTPEGETLSFLVDGTTVFKSKDGSVDAFEDLKVGMLVAVVAKTEAGQLRAMAVLAGAAEER